MPQAPAAATTEPGATGTDPWPKWGRMLGGAWIFFLAYPIVAALHAPVAPWLRYACVLLLIAFAVIYVVFFTSIADADRYARQWVVLGVLILIAVAVSPVIGINYFSYKACVTATRAEVQKQDPTGLYAKRDSAPVQVAAK